MTPVCAFGGTGGFGVGAGGRDGGAGVRGFGCGVGGAGAGAGEGAGAGAGSAPLSSITGPSFVFGGTKWIHTTSARLKFDISVTTSPRVRLRRAPLSTRPS